MRMMTLVRTSLYLSCSWMACLAPVMAQSVGATVTPAARASAPVASAGHAHAPKRPGNTLSFGTLLYSADERALLEGRRPRGEELPALNEQSEIRFDGYVRQTNQAPVIWLNGETTAARDDLKFDQEHAIVRINGRARQRLAAGQSIGKPELGEGNSASVVVPGRQALPTVRQWNLGGTATERGR